MATPMHNAITTQSKKNGFNNEFASYAEVEAKKMKNEHKNIR
ncbi:hypothetical protein [Parageobacillus toebii]|nr:hypothetical protein [Parageobacillus toebii]